MDPRYFHHEGPSNYQHDGHREEFLADTIGELVVELLDSEHNLLISVIGVSRPGELHPLALSERCGKIKRTSGPLGDCSRQIKKSDFEYDDERNCFTCPGGHTLELKWEGKDGTRVYQAERKACEKCAYKERCCKSEKGEARTINTDSKEPQRQKMNKKMEQADSKEVYKKRKQIVEPVFGQIKKTEICRSWGRNQKGLRLWAANSQEGTRVSVVPSSIR